MLPQLMKTTRETVERMLDDEATPDQNRDLAAKALVSIEKLDERIRALAPTVIAEDIAPNE